MRFRTDPSGLRGSHTALMTPFTEDFELDLDSLRRLCRWQVRNGAHGLSIGGSTGEPGAQTAEERIETMRVVAEATADEVPFFAGTGSLRLDETIRLTAAADELGADAALIVTPYYARPTQDALFHWYATIAAEFPRLPIVIYNVPMRTAVDIAPDTVRRLRLAHDNIVGIKETTKDFEHFSRVLYACGRDLLVWSGIELLCLPALSLGAAGFISALANLAPGAVARMYETWTSGRHEEAIGLHYALHPLTDLLFLETNPSPGKWALRQLGVIASDAVRPPLLPLSGAARQQARHLLEQCRALVPADLEELSS